MKRFVDVGADVSVVTADKYDAIRLERLENKAKNMGNILKFKMGSTHYANETGAVFFLFHTQTVSSQVKEKTDTNRGWVLEYVLEVHQMKTLARSQPKS